jgi:hypothetical protein
MNILPKGTKVRVIAEVEANSVKVGDIRKIVCRFELPEGRYYRVTSTRTDTNFTGALVPASAIEAI